MRQVRKNEACSNATGFWLGTTIFGTSLVIFANLAPQTTPHWGGLLPLAGFSSIPLGIAWAELRSAYAWKNLAPRGHGIALTAAPVRYWCSVSFHLLLAGVIKALNVWAFLHA